MPGTMELQREVAVRPETRREARRWRLNDREADLLRLWAEGLTDRQAARAMGTSLRTVGRISATLMARMGARSRFQAGWLALGGGWLHKDQPQYHDEHSPAQMSAG